MVSNIKPHGIPSIFEKYSIIVWPFSLAGKQGLNKNYVTKKVDNTQDEYNINYFFQINKIFGETTISMAQNIEIYHHMPQQMSRINNLW